MKCDKHRFGAAFARTFPNPHVTGVVAERISGTGRKAVYAVKWEDGVTMNSTASHLSKYK